MAEKRPAETSTEEPASKKQAFTPEMYEELKAQIAELQTFVSRFSANASKAKQATSRAKQIDKIQLEEVKASSRQNPFIRFEQSKELFRNALVVENLSQGFEEDLFNNINIVFN